MRLVSYEASLNRQCNDTRAVVIEWNHRRATHQLNNLSDCQHVFREISMRPFDNLGLKQALPICVKSSRRCV